MPVAELESFTGECPRCGKSVLQDSQGGWF